MMTSQVALAQPMPAYLGGGTGAVLTLSQTPCNNPANPGACCNSKGTICANWAGAHLVSAGCIQYGVLELEAAFNMPANAGGFYFTATYVVFGGSDPAWNEIDIGMINNVLGQLEFHATVFTANKAAPTGTLMDALNFAQSPNIGTSINVNTPIKAINGITSVPRYYNTSFANAFHTYKIVWTPTTVAWMVDTVVYRNLTYAPWRPMSIRQILRTNAGTNTGPAYGDSNVYIRRIRYTPLSDQAVADAYRCTSMFACYGALPAAPTGTATAYVSLASGGAGAPTGRRMLMAAAMDQGLALASAVAGTVQGMPATNVTATPTAFALTFRIKLTNLLTAVNSPTPPTDPMAVYQGDLLQQSLLSGLADDVIPSPENVIIEDVTTDASNTIVVVSVMVMGYNSMSDLLNDYQMFIQGGATQLDGTAASLNNAMGLAANAYITSAAGVNSTDPNYTPVIVPNPTPSSTILADPTKCPNYPLAWDNTCVDGSGNAPAVWCASCVLLDMDQLQMVTTYGVTLPVPASAVDAVEASVNSAISSGSLGASGSSRRRLLQAGGGVNLTSTNNLALQRILTSDVAPAPDVAVVCATVETKERQWRAAAIAFIVSFGVLAIVVIAFSLGKSTERRAIVQLMTQQQHDIRPTKMDTTV